MLFHINIIPITKKFYTHFFEGVKDPTCRETQTLSGKLVLEGSLGEGSLGVSVGSCITDPEEVDRATGEAESLE